MNLRHTRSILNHCGTRRAPVALLLAASIGIGGSTVAAQQAVSSVARPWAAAKGLTIDAVLGSPFPSEISPAPKGGAIAWVVNVRGARNVWVAEPPAYQGRRLTSYTADDGQELGQLAWSSDGRTLVYVRGGSPNRAGEHPNPTSGLGATEQALWRIALTGGEPVRIDAGTSPVVSPTQDVVAFTQRGQIALAPLGGGEAKPIGHVRGGASALRWSPDGSKLAFSSRRGDHALIGVYDYAQKAISWLAPSTDQDLAPAWSPDGKRVAFVRIPSSAEGAFFGPNRDDPPWSIMVADVATGAARAVWHATPGKGSVFYPLQQDDQLFWGAGDRIVFPWEKDGWQHLYSVAAAGGEAKLLTPGAFEIQQATLARDRASVIYASNQDDVDRRHLWSVGVSGGAPKALTSGRGIEWSPVVTSEGALALLHSGARRPATAALLDGGKFRELAPAMLADYPAEDEFAEPEQVVFRSADGMPIHAQLFLPRGARSGEKHPALVFVHGGPTRQMMLGFHPMDFYHYSYALNQYLASKGYVVLSVNYRSGIGYGMEFREAEHYGATGASEVKDVLGAGLYLQGRADVDPERVGIFGGSYGGYLTAQALAHASDMFKVGVDYAGVHDWNAIHEFYVPSYNVRDNPEEAAIAREASPIAWVDRWRSPVLMIQADDDRNVPFSETVTIVAALRQRGVDVEEIVFPDEVHDMLMYRNLLAYANATEEFLGRHLMRKGERAGR
ncbi:MAG TPA: prolyl oligopeptidase family serine peptidase [Gemmatimonadaceae bacterium]